ncbi:molybdopterin molybdotransferase MoeA [Paenibacillus eucommiae]|uniref:Molybdopterin molybdenumtransferase n=1 Tax=Paenibacillus eucommiae TaxID=1355755 RepID=A0ABS4IZE1_9BACL|nr:gephyrin-like molybdotransferase Glp [Paenibacillus eucommiae]MBP1992952.1 molybdopterin molybdotransferase [Paenibacillus eucommiae]
MNKERNLKFGRETISVQQARERLLPYIKPIQTEQVPLVLAFGRRMAQTIYAAHPVPHFRRSGVDGYAVRAVDIAAASAIHPVELEVVEHIPCGTIPLKRVGAGEASRIMTGAPVPDGADAVVMLEMTQTQEDGQHAADPTVLRGSGKKVWIKKALQSGNNLTPVAGEISQGELLLSEGTWIGAGVAAILATFGCGDVAVYRKPRVAIFSTGSELLDVTMELEPGRIRNSNSYMLAAQVEAAGGIPVIMPALSDHADQVQAALIQAFESADCVITTGGVSVGDYDVLVEVFGSWQGTLLFNKVAMRPGSPTSAAVWQDKLLFALSGNPGASFVGFELFVRPALESMQGHQQPCCEAATAFLDVDYDKGSAYPRYVRGTTRIENGCLWVRPAGADKSSIMVSIKDADCLIQLPAGGSGFRRGELVAIQMLVNR